MRDDSEGTYRTSCTECTELLPMMKTAVKPYNRLSDKQTIDDRCIDCPATREREGYMYAACKACSFKIEGTMGQDVVGVRHGSTSHGYRLACVMRKDSE